MTTGSLINNIINASASPVPEVGMGATICHWTDRSAATVSFVSANGKTIRTQADNAIRIDKNGQSESQTYEFERIPDAPEATWTLRKNGRWIRKGDPMRGGQTIHLGVRSAYYDYSF